MLGLVLSIKKFKLSSTTTEYDNSMKQLNKAKSNPGAGNYASDEFGINSPIKDIHDTIKQNKNIHKIREN